MSATEVTQLPYFQPACVIVDGKGLGRAPWFLSYSPAVGTPRDLSVSDALHPHQAQ